MGEVEYWNLSRLRESMRLSNESELSNLRRSAGERTKRPSSRVVLIAAFGAVYLIWGSTYLGIKYAIETIPPLLMAGSRFLIAGALLCLWSRLRGANDESSSGRSTRSYWRTAIIVGFALFLIGNGGVTWAEHRIASSLAALLVATEPLWIVLLNWTRAGGERPRPKTLLGLSVGFAGVWLLLSPGGSEASAVVDVGGACVVLFAAFSWAAGSLYSLRAPRPSSPLLASGMQMIAGGALLLVASLLTGEWRRFDVSAVSWRSMMALAYLIFFGSIIAFTAYSWLLHAVAPARAATYAYVNPAVAVLLGWALGGEVMTLRTLLGAAVIVASVGLITSYRKRADRDLKDSASDTASSRCTSSVVCVPQRSS